MQRVKSGPSKAEVKLSIDSAEQCAAYLSSAGVLLRLCEKHSRYKGLRAEWPDDQEAWAAASAEVGLRNPDTATISNVLSCVYDRGIGITYMATIERPAWIYDGFELLMAIDGPTCRFVVRCEKTGVVKTASVEWQHYKTHWARVHTKIGPDALRCLSLVGYGAAYKWPYAWHGLSGKLFRARYQPRIGEPTQDE